MFYFQKVSLTDSPNCSKPGTPLKMLSSFSWKSSSSILPRKAMKTVDSICCPIHDKLLPWLPSSSSTLQPCPDSEYITAAFRQPLGVAGARRCAVNPGGEPQQYRPTLATLLALRCTSAGHVTHAYDTKVMRTLWNSGLRLWFKNERLDITFLKLMSANNIPIDWSCLELNMS